MGTHVLELRDPDQMFEVHGLLRLRNEMQSGTVDLVRAQSAAQAVGITRNLQRAQNGGEFFDWLHVLTRPTAS